MLQARRERSQKRKKLLAQTVSTKIYPKKEAVTIVILKIRINSRVDIKIYNIVILSIT